MCPFPDCRICEPGVNCFPWMFPWMFPWVRVNFLDRAGSAIGLIVGGGEGRLVSGAILL